MNVDRAERSVLATPGSNPQMIVKALASDADLVMIDLEDAVAPDAKAAARATVAEALREGDWQGRPRTFRINALDTPWFVRDLIEVIDGAQGRVDLIVMPKVACPEDVHVVATILGSLQGATEARRPIGLEMQIESAAGLAQCEAIAAASPRVEALVFGPGDYAASVRMPLAAIGMPDRWDTDYPGHRWDYPLQRILVAARAAGVRAIDGPYADFRDRDGFRRSCLVARALGYDGKWCIHPDQIPIANEVFSSGEAELAWAREVLAAQLEAEQAGRGSFALNGQMVDAATLRMALATLARASHDRD
ncbi:MAG TPA: CoA ester lyase [Thermomicrobiales bacterium]|nr:CoA ester lyase [Thermomicrobiales bacterium]